MAGTERTTTSQGRATRPPGAPLLAPALVLLACGNGPAKIEVEPFGDAELTVLYVGNSLTAANDLPGMVGVLAEATGHGYEYRALLRPNFALSDHWASGAADVVRELGADVVVLQQGPSSVGDNPLHLRTWTDTFASVIREAGGEPALLMVWPESIRMEAFDAVHDSYARAAEAVDGLFIPAGESWRSVWALDPDAELYGADGFHPSRIGTFVAALTAFATLFDEDVRELPPLVVDAEETAVLYEAVQATIETVASQQAAAPIGSPRAYR